MTITWYGFSCFKIEEKLHGVEASLVIDPFESEDGKKLPRNLAADIVVSSHDHARHNNVAAVAPASGEKAPFVITGPGEFEVKEMFVTGIPTYHDLVEGKEKGTNTMCYITVGDVHCVHLGDLKHPLEERHMEDFHDVDILFVPVGGGSTLNAKQAAEVVGQLEPRMIVPMHYRSGGVGAKLDGVEPFLKAMGMGKPEVLSKLKISGKELPQEESRIVLLEMQ